METLSLKEITDYVESNIDIFHQKRIASLDKLKLSKILERKNPYLFKAKSIVTAGELVKSLVDAHISSNEETIFGDWLEGLAIFVNSKVFGGRKSGITGIDLEFDTVGTRFILSIKSGPNWGNSSQIKKLKADFNAAKKALRTSGSGLNIVAVNGCCYGKDGKPDKGEYFKYCGQEFWAFISGDEDFYLKIIEPLAHRAKERNEDFNLAYVKMINKFTLDFINTFCDTEGAIDWEKIVRLNSQARKAKS